MARQRPYSSETLTSKRDLSGAMSQPPRYESPLFRSFKAIEADSYRSILRFVEDHLPDISLLPVEEYFSLQHAYVAALYETGAYEKVVALSQQLLELSIIHNIYEIEGEDVYRVLLLRRASAEFYLMNYAESTRLCDQMLRLYPDFKEASILFERSLYQKPNGWVSKARATSVALFLLAAFLIAIEVLVVQSFWPEHTRAMMWLRNLSFLAGWLLLLGGDIIHRSWAWGKVRRLGKVYALRRAGRLQA
jgi:Galactose-1-phosphate uridylyltransferase